MTRKIEIQMNAAVQSGTNFSKANTTVSHHEGVAIVRLHGNKIAEVGEDFMTLFDGGYQSNTTKSRLNALLAEFGHDGERVFAKAFNWFVQQDGGPVPFFSGMRLN
jgi:hypothetical protein